ncbi:tetratricopeptide repeat-containing sensor histidine kinase [Euzebyella saccharophila]|uniref:histidine kinase n=1 Tax=Euzebyella saccharophila TaxID=679664 RepID=A0ABV8JQ07_9FLAO|nr:ATP-binding protein [Euzebyella saccharophila]
MNNQTLKVLLIFSLTIVLGKGVCAQNNSEEQQISFSTEPNERDTSLNRYYRTLTDSVYGPNRFLAIMKLAGHHIDKANSDSIIQYGNKYLIEIRHWNADSLAKSRHFSKAYYILGIGSRFNGLLDNATKWHIQGIKEAESSLQKEFLFRNKIGLANTYNLKQEPQKAIEILEPIIDDLVGEYQILLPKAITFLGDAYYVQKKYTRAQEIYNNGLQKAREQKDDRQALTLELKLGSLAELDEDYDKAFELYNTAREKGMQEGFLNIYFEGTIRMGELFYREKNFDAANAALSVAYFNAIQRDNLYYQKEILDIQRKVFNAKEDYSNAYAVMTQMAGINQQIAHRQQQKVIKELEIQYETLEKDKEISELEENQILKEAELKAQRTIKNAILIGFLVVLIPVLGLLYVYYQKIQAQTELAKKKEEVNIQKLQALKKDQELDLIKASIEAQDEERKRIAQELHDSIGGNLAGIKLQISGEENNTDNWNTIKHQLDETYQLVRNISHTLIPKKFKEKPFTQLISDYIDTISINGNLKVSFHKYPNEEINALKDALHLQLYKIIQELMTNTIKHAQADHVSINLTLTENELSLLFEDNGVGFDSKNTTNGIGLENVNSRVQELNGTLQIDSSVNRGTVAVINIPIT